VPEIEHKNKLENYIFLFEELENNLHPSLERRLLKYIEEVANNGATIFLTTHSSTMLDGFQNKENVQLYHVIKENDDVVIKSLDDFYGKSGCLDDLGIKASDILQSNGIIWVEGPSDRIYINKWIELWSDGTLKEGMDYQCVFYGGRLLSNVTFDPNEIDELIKLVNINKNSIILIDSDITEEGKRINQTKARIRKEVELNNNMCWITKGKEIENYIPQKILEEKYNKKFKHEFKRYDKINEYLNKEVGELAVDKFFRSKVEFAKSVTQLMTKDNMKDFLNLDLNMKKVIGTIKLWNEK
jgi:predicted ATP-dependent endonuclease of OLD family